MSEAQDERVGSDAGEDENTAPTYGLNEEIVQDIQEAIEREDSAYLHEKLEDWHAADVADLIEQLKPKLRLPFMRIMEDRIDPDVYSALDENVREHLVDEMEPAEIAAFINELELDDAVDFLENFEEEDRRDVLNQIPPDERAVLQEGLSYGEDTAGRLMQRDLIAVPEYWNIGQTIDYMRDTENLPDEFYEIFVVDPRHHPIGTIPLNRAMRSKRHVMVRDIMDAEQKLIPVDMDQEEVAYLFKQYRLASAAVVNDDGALIGVITVDDIVDVINEEAEEDILRLGGVSEDDLFSSVYRTIRARFPWLFVNLLTALAASFAISLFDATMEAVIALAVLMPIAASMGGNAGTQALTVAVRALATKELTTANMFRILNKEALVALTNGSIFACMVGTVAWLWFGNPLIGGIVAAALVVNILVAGVIGMIVPVMLERLKIDPAIASGVFVTTVTDIVGFVVFLGLATLILL
ncbi:MAG: magnesium transporter [Sneathiella sp.]|jgi:magnesium transporter|uniref:magnesium transporter n=1 Tax=Sneathiella sp. TaxID=1964365 RepID=UPI000C4781DF|nr:magnesium transporter [Sneathiella sp.]MAL79820.1 magnesium transporter [Sneathiella sp.]